MLARLRSIEARLLPRGLMDVVRQVLLFALAYYGYRLVRGTVDDPVGAAVAFQHSREVIHLEQSLGIFVEPSIQGWVSGRPLVIDVASWLYLNAQFTVTMGCLVYIYLRHNSSFYFVRNMFAVAMWTANAGFMLFPAAPPRFFPEWGFVDSVSSLTHVSHDSVAVNSLVNQYAAIPSMHVAFALMIAVPLARLSKHRVTRVIWTLYPFLVVLVIISTGNHFITDGVLGAATAGFAAWTAAWLARARPAAWAFQPAKATA
jgi:membrane-associated phospholipid phosphatase